MNKLGAKNKIALKDYITYGLATLSIFVNIVLAGKMVQINQSTQIIQQNNYYNQLPSEIRGQIDKIEETSGNVMTFTGIKNNP